MWVSIHGLTFALLPRGFANADVFNGIPTVLSRQVHSCLSVFIVVKSFSFSPFSGGEPSQSRLVSAACVTLSAVELKEQSFAPTLAHKLGDVPHVSGLLRRIAQLSGAVERVSEWLLKVAVARGANHYRRDFDPTLPADLPAISDEEIGVALCLGQNPYNLDFLRVAAQFLSSPRINAARLCQLAVQERCEPVLLHIAGIAGNMPRNKSRGFRCENICAHVACREPMHCRTGRASSATRGSREKGRRERIGSLAMNNPSTKMARGDENDLADIRFLLQQETISADQLRAAFTRARVPDVPEIQELFRFSQPKLLALISTQIP